MESKEIIFFLGLFIVVPIGLVLSIYSRKIREALFFCFILGTMATDLIDVNFISREWYRGTTRGVEISYVDFMLVILFLSTFFVNNKNKIKPRYPKTFWIMFVFILYCIFNISVNSPQLFGVFEVVKILRGMLIFFTVYHFIQGEREVQILVFALSVVLIFQGFTVLKERYLLGGYRVGGTFHHPNSLSMYSVMAAPILLSCYFSNLKKWIRYICIFGMLSAFLCVVLSVSRTGIATLLVILPIVAFFSGAFKVGVKSIFTMLVIVFILGGVLYRSSDTLMNRVSSRSFDEEYSGKGIKGRGVYIRLARNIMDEKIFGVGLNNWSYAVSGKYGRQIGMNYISYRGPNQWPDQEVPYGSGLDSAQAAPAHNLLSLMGGELGWPGLILFLYMWYKWGVSGFYFLKFKSNDFMLRFGLGVFFSLLAVFTQSLTEWVFRQTQIYFLFHTLLGALMVTQHLVKVKSYHWKLVSNKMKVSHKIKMEHV